MAHSKAAWLMGGDEEEMSLEWKGARDSFILSFLSPHFLFSNDTGNLESILCEKEIRFLFQNNLSVVHLGKLEGDVWSQQTIEE